jgi:hypothetical protein
VRVTGVATVDAASNRITSIKISDIERIESREDEVTEVLPSGAPLPGDFWKALSFDELAMAQHVSAITHIDGLVGSWPGDIDDDFEGAIRRLRSGQAN